LTKIHTAPTNIVQGRQVCANNSIDEFISQIYGLGVHMLIQEAQSTTGAMWICYPTNQDPFSCIQVDVFEFITDQKSVGCFLELHEQFCGGSVMFFGKAITFHVVGKQLPLVVYLKCCQLQLHDFNLRSWQFNASEWLQ